MLKYIKSDKILENKKEYDTLFINTSFTIEDLSDINPIEINDDYFKTTFELIENSYYSLKTGGLLFLYGAPKYLAFYANFLNNLEKEDTKFLFKYWIGIKFEEMFLNQPLPNSHIGLLMYLKTKTSKNPTPFRLNTKEYRIPYSNCKACGNNLKDWGGKTHLMNPIGTSLSDVWSDLNLDKNELNNPQKIIERVYNMTITNGKDMLIINENLKKNKFVKEKSYTNDKVHKINIENFNYLNAVVKMDCIKFMDNIKELYPEGIYDLAFADPPYNLEKNYLKYDDDKEELEYIDWCNKWLDGMFDILKPGGSLLVLNIPKWAIQHYINLAPKMNFRNWIIWDALSTPSGKLLPAHYSLIHFTKPTSSNESNTITNKIEIDSRDYCLRNNCVKTRKLKKEDNKEVLSDIWRDVHRIKHKKDRDLHPCQLPTKLMSRIIEIYSKEGDLIFDPFGGAGTTAISAIMNNRNYTITDIDAEYFDIALTNLENIKKTNEGEFVFERKSVKRPKESQISQKQIEKKYIEICIKYNYALNIEEIERIDIDLYKDINNHYPRENNYLKKIAKRQLENLIDINQKDL